MPYIIKKVKGGYKVCKEDNKKCFSKKALNLETATKQRKAIGLSGGTNENAETVKGLSNLAVDAVGLVPGFGTAFSVFSPLVKTGLNALIDTIMYDPEAERRAKIKAEWQDYIREKSLRRFGRELSPEEYRYVNYELKKRKWAELAKQRAEAIERDTKKAQEAGFNTIGEYTANIKIKGRENLKERLKRAGFTSGREYQQAKKRGEVSEEQKAIMEGNGKPKDEKLYKRIKEKIYENNPRHSLFRSALIQKEYKRAGGTYEKAKGEPLEKAGKINKWFNQKWISLNDYIRGLILDCGSSDTEAKYGEYPLCRPLKLAEKLGKNKIKKMIEEKNKLEEKPLQTEKLFNTKEFNIKSTLTGTGKDKFIKQLEKLNFPPEAYLMVAREVAKREGYDPEKLTFSNNNDNKLKYDSPEGIKYFGKAGYGDYIIWLFKEKKGQVAGGYADMKRRVFRKSHGAISKIHNLNKFSPNELSINILW